MRRLVLSHLVLIGTNKPNATIEFGPQLTLVRGPSDTGKSFIVNAIDFMLGAKSLKEIPERSGYSDVLLGLMLPSGEKITLARSVRGGVFRLYLGDVRSGPLGIPARTLAPKHSAKNESTLSHYLLEATGLAGKLLRTNASNATNSLSFRDLAHLTVIDETQMQSEVSPALTGRFTTRTREISALKLILQNEDDAGLEATTPKKDAKKLSTAKIEVVDQLIEDLESRLANYDEEAQLRQQLTHLGESLQKENKSVQGLLDHRNFLVDKQRITMRKLRIGQYAMEETLVLKNRFTLLREKYDSDLSRLEMVSEAGNLLSYFTPEECVLCGAAPEHQEMHVEGGNPTGNLSEAVEAEKLKTARLRDDLLLTLSDLDSRSTELLRAQETLEDDVEYDAIDLALTEKELLPKQSELQQLMEARSLIEKSLDLHTQIAALQRMKIQVKEDASKDAVEIAGGLELRPLHEFSGEIAARLKTWGFPNASHVRYDRSEQDVISAGQLRAAHGKGVRSILHAAFTVALAQYCFDRDLPHPGFVVLDSPLITYRAPDAPDGSGPDQSVATAFYQDLQDNFDGQVIVMENTDPLEPLSEDTMDTTFTASSKVGRFGFFPEVIS